MTTTGHTEPNAELWRVPVTYIL